MSMKHQLNVDWTFPTWWPLVKDLIIIHNTKTPSSHPPEGHSRPTHRADQRAVPAARLPVPRGGGVQQRVGGSQRAADALRGAAGRAGGGGGRGRRGGRAAGVAAPGGTVSAKCVNINVHGMRKYR